MKREEIIRDLVERSSGAGAGQYISIRCDVAREIVALLKEQEARVMTLKELQAIETPWNRNTPPYLFVERRSFAESRWMSWGFLHDGVRLRGTMGVQNYGSKWRVWNLQPTPEQMRDMPWEDEAK